jgi:adenylate kinase
MIICVSGSVASGKTEVAKLIAKKYKLKYVDVNKLIKKHKLYEKYDRKLKTYVVGIKKLNNFLIKLIKKNKNLVIDSHLSHYLPKKYIDLCVITKCNLKVLEKRLKKRKYSKEKIRENLDAEIFDVCLNEAREKKHKIKIIDTTKGLKKLKDFI